MDLLENNTHSFVVKISVEEGIEEGEKAKWQGNVMHVATGHNYTFTKWEKMEDFLKSYLEVMLSSGSKFARNYWWSRHQSYPTDD